MSYLWQQKKVGQQIFSPPSFVAVVGSEIRDIRNTADYRNPKEHWYLPNKSRILGVSSLAGSGAGAAEAANGLLALAVLRNFSIAAALNQSIRSIVTIDRYNRSVRWSVFRRIRIGSGFNLVIRSVSGFGIPIRKSGFGIRIRIQEGKNDPCFEVLDVLFWELKASSVALTSFMEA